MIESRAGSLPSAGNGTTYAFRDWCARKRCCGVKAANARSCHRVEKSKIAEYSRIPASDSSSERSPNAAAFVATEIARANFLRLPLANAGPNSGKRDHQWGATRSV